MKVHTSQGTLRRKIFNERVVAVVHRIKSGRGRAEWDEAWGLWAIEEQFGSLPVGARVITSLAARRYDCGGFRGRRLQRGFGLSYTTS